MFCVCVCYSYIFCFFFFNDTATTEIYTLSLHDALPISPRRKITRQERHSSKHPSDARVSRRINRLDSDQQRSEEHTSELQSQSNLVCRLLLEKKKTYIVNDSLSALQFETQQQALAHSPH